MSLVQPEGYLALPAAGTGCAVLVLHAWWGLNEMVKGVCTRLADAGYAAFAPDLYHGKVTDQIAEAEVFSGAVFGKLGEARADLAAAAAFLSKRAGTQESGMAVIGFSLGAFFALDLSVTAPEAVRAVVAFYGTRPGEYEGSQAAYLGHFAEHDEFEPASEVNLLEAALKRAGCPAAFYHYPGTGHWFFEPDRTQAYDAAAADLAWERTLAFLAGAARL